MTEGLMKRVSISYLDKTSLLQENIAIRCIKISLQYFAAFLVSCGGMHIHI
jgi:hypothetical protein